MKAAPTLRSATKTEYFFDRPNAHNRVKIATITSIPVEAFFELADSVVRGRKEAAGVDRDFTTADIVGSVYGGDTATKSQRVAVLRVLTRLPPGRLPGMGEWTFGRKRNRRGWFLVAPHLQQAQGEPPSSAPAPRSDGRLAASMRLLGSPVPGERDAALLAAGRLLEARGLTWSDVARAVERLA